jgi:Importin-beta N-terminal domain
LINIRSI